MNKCVFAFVQVFYCFCVHDPSHFRLLHVGSFKILPQLYRYLKYLTELLKYMYITTSLLVESLRQTFISNLAN